MAVQDLNAIAFPVLSEAQIAQLGRYAGAPPKKLENLPGSIVAEVMISLRSGRRGSSCLR